MKKIASAITLMLACNNVSAFVDLDCISPYVGIDYQHRWMRGTMYHGFDLNEIFPTSYPGFNGYVGIRTKNVGLELGGQYSQAKRKTEMNDINFSAIGGYLDLVGYYYLLDCVEILGTMGAGYDVVRLNNNFRSRSAHIQSLVGRVRVGGNFFFTECFGARATLGYETTRLLKAKDVNSGAIVRPFKDSLLASLGVFYKF